MKKILCLLAALTITACTTTPHRLPVADPDQKWQQRQQTLAKINDWHLHGRVAIINGDESWNLSMSWQRHDDKYILDLSGPLGIGHSQLTGTKDGVVLVDSDKNYFYAESPDKLLSDTTGLRMPVKDLFYWMRGLPNPNLNSEQQKLDAFGRLAQLQQGGWRVRFKRYSQIDQHELPQKIFIDGFNVKVKIFVDEWNLKTKTFIKTEE